MSALTISVSNYVKQFISFILTLFKVDANKPEQVVEINDVNDDKLNDDVTTKKVINNINFEFPGDEFKRLRRLLTNEAKYTPPGNARTLVEALNANAVGNIPETLDCPGEAVIKPFCSRVSYTIWVLYDREHNPHVIQPHPTRGPISVGPDMLTMDAPAEPMPDDVTHAIKIVIGTKLFDCHLNGFSIQHFVDFDWYGRQ